MTDGIEYKAILGRKEGMTQAFDEAGRVVPVTVVTAGPCVVTQVKSTESDGYHAVQVGFLDQKPQRLRKPQRVEAEKRGVPPHRLLRELRLPGPSQHGVGEVIRVDTFEPGDVVDVIGRCKGRGFQGGVRAWNFAGKRQTHGNMDQRGPGAIGMHTYPGRVLKGKKMPVRWGNERITSKNHAVVAVDTETNTMLVRGSIPGSNNGLVLIRTARSRRVPKG